MKWGYKRPRGFLEISKEVAVFYLIFLTGDFYYSIQNLWWKSFNLFNYRQTTFLGLIENITKMNIKKSNRDFMTLSQNHDIVIVFHQMIGNNIIAWIIWNNWGEKMAGSISSTQVMNKITPINIIHILENS